MRGQKSERSDYAIGLILRGCWVLIMDGHMGRQTDIYNSRVTFTTEKKLEIILLWSEVILHQTVLVTYKSHLQESLNPGL